MRLRNQTITTGLKRKELPPVAYERIDSNNIRIGTKWFHLSRNLLAGGFQHGVLIYHDRGTKQFIANSWYNINTSGTYEEFERSFELWIKSL